MFGVLAGPGRHFDAVPDAVEVRFDPITGDRNVHKVQDDLHRHRDGVNRP